jgi:hypothetical protein
MRPTRRDIDHRRLHRRAADQRRCQGGGKRNCSAGQVGRELPCHQ